LKREKEIGERGAKKRREEETSLEKQLE